MSNRNGLPGPLFGDNVKAIAMFSLAAAIIIGFVWVRYYAPCQWWSSMSVSDTPIRCLDIDRR